MTGTDRNTVNAETEMLSAKIETLLAAALAANSMLRVCLSDYSHPSFTDRHGMADRLRDRIEKVDAYILKATGGDR